MVEFGRSKDRGWLSVRAIKLLLRHNGATSKFVEEVRNNTACRRGSARACSSCSRRRGASSPTSSCATSNLASGRADGGWQQRLGRYLSPDLLILDDFAMREYTLAQAEDLYELVPNRYRRGPLILTTNREPRDLYALFPNPVLAEGLLDRLQNRAYVITMLGQSYRPRLRPDQPSEEPGVEAQHEQDPDDDHR
jgi:hypothetical protein